MSSSGDRPAAVTCPHCGQTFADPDAYPETHLPAAERRRCPKCGGKLGLSAESAPLSPFDDLFDDRGEPKWAEPTGAVELEAAETLLFPDDSDPLALEPTRPLIPLESESPGHFDFPEAAAAEPADSSRGGENRAGEAPSPGPAGLPPGSDSPRRPKNSADLLDELELEPLDASSALRQSPNKAPPLSPIFSTGDAASAEDDQPLRIEGFESAGPPESMTGVRCRICETLIYVQRSELGQKIKCPECYSEVLAEEAAPRKTTGSGFPQTSSDHVVWTTEEKTGQAEIDLEDDEYRLSDPVERPQVDIPSHYGLDAASTDLLAPLPPEGSDADSPELGAPREAEQPAREKTAERPGSEPRTSTTPQVGTERTKAEPALPASATVNSGSRTTSTPGGTASSAASSSAPSPTGKGLPPYWQQKPARPESPPSADASSGESLELDDLAAPGPAMRNWLGKLLLDPRLWIAGGAATAVLGIGYWLIGLASSWLSGPEAPAIGSIILALMVGLPGLLCFLLGMGAAAVIAALLFHLGARRQPQLSAWKGAGFAELGPVVGFVAFGFFVAVLPGAICGMLLAVLTGAPVWIYVLGSLSGSILAPLLLASACRSDSPFRILDRKILQQIRFENVDWLKFLPGSLLGFGVFLFGSLLLLIPGVIGASLGAIGQVAGWAIFGSLTGLFCGLLVEKLNSGEHRE